MIEVKHIIDFFPYSLKMQYQDEKDKTILKLTGININKIISLEGQEDILNASDWKPILRNSNDIFKEIKLNRNTFVPIYELAKIASGLSFIEKPVIDSSVSILRFIQYGVNYKFQITNGCNVIMINEDSGNMIVVQNQPKIFEKLSEWHFDWKYDLISQGIAIDINTI